MLYYHMIERKGFNLVERVIPYIISMVLWLLDQYVNFKVYFAHYMSAFAIYMLRVIVAITYKRVKIIHASPSADYSVDLTLPLTYFFKMYSDSKYTVSCALLQNFLSNFTSANKIDIIYRITHTLYKIHLDMDQELCNGLDLNFGEIKLDADSGLLYR